MCVGSFPCEEEENRKNPTSRHKKRPSENSKDIFITFIRYSGMTLDFILWLLFNFK